MRRLLHCFLALTIVLSPAAAIAQPATLPSDAFGQSPIEPVVPAPPKPRVKISNGMPGEVPELTGQARRTTRGEPVRTGRGEPERAVRGESDESAEAAPAAVAPNKLVKPSEFQSFIAENFGMKVPVFGSEYFLNAPSTFAPITNSPVPAEHRLGPGDALLIRAWGSIDIDYRATIDRNGTINIPTIGTVVLGGVRAGDAEQVIRSAVARLYKGVTVNVNFGQLRAITVYVVGQASRPGTYTVSSLSTLVTALFVSGGPNSNGSMRRVQLKRGGRVAAELDLYGFIAKGDKSADIQLQDGDTIYIPPAGGHVAVLGKVHNPAIFELRGNDDTVGSLLALGGGLPVVADPRRAFLERIDPNRSQPRSVEQFSLDAAGNKKVLRNGDVLNITSITPDFSNAVVLRGNVDQPIRAPFVPGMRITDLIPNKAYLITRNSVQRQNNAMLDEELENGGAGIAARIGGLVDEINWDYAVIERINRADLSVKLIPFNLGKAFDQAEGPDNVRLVAGDTVTIFSQKDVSVPLEKRAVFVRIEGEVKVPGVYQMMQGENLQNLLARAGGPTSNAYLFGTGFFREQVRVQQQANLETVVSRLEAQMRQEQAKSVVNVRGDSVAAVQLAEVKRQAELVSARETIERLRKLRATGRIAFGLDPTAVAFAALPPLKLENGDRLVVPFRPEFVHIFGAVNAEASALWRKGRTVRHYLAQAGLRQEADEDNIFVMRVDGSIADSKSGGWLSRGADGIMVYPGDSIVVPDENFVRESFWSRFTNGTKEWAQIFANLGLGAAAIQVLK